ncbi:MAG: hypothetical protein BWY99_02902 [Synergistetes bacterium ADurb.BinA166]|nr:MAG: hypothetical protein BWY99_02902 [Synergistetes bacterium ADurb.BinA166]
MAKVESSLFAVPRNQTFAGRAIRPCDILRGSPGAPEAATVSSRELPAGSSSRERNSEK